MRIDGNESGETGVSLFGTGGKQRLVQLLTELFLA